MPKVIVAIGGGKRPRGTRAIDREIVRLSGKAKPNLLFVPTASSDDVEYWKNIQKYFGGLKCRTSVLFLIRERPPLSEIRKKILSADIIYVGGGNTLKMMRLWRRLGVDRLLKQAYEKGTVLCGISAGAICWFDSGHSDSMSYYNPRKWKYINVKGLGLIPAVHCPHYNSQTLGVPRKKDFQNMMHRMSGVGIAIENNCAIEFIDGKLYKVIPSKKHAGAYKLYRSNDKVCAERIRQERKLMPLAHLTDREPGEKLRANPRSAVRP